VGPVFFLDTISPILERRKPRFGNWSLESEG